MYVVFAGDSYYACGGWYDYQDSYTSEEEAKGFCKGWTSESMRWAHVVHEGDIIYEESS